MTRDENLMNGNLFSPEARIHKADWKPDRLEGEELLSGRCPVCKRWIQGGRQMTRHRQYEEKKKQARQLPNDCKKM